MIPSGNSSVPPSNFFLPPIAESSNENKTSAKIQTILQDAHTLNRLAQSHDITHFLNQTPTICRAEISAMASLADKISKTMDTVVRSRSITAIGRRSPRQQRHSGVVKKSTKQSLYSGFPAADEAYTERRCHMCGVTQTPRWRGGTSSGSRLLCNVCGLVQTRRFARKLLVSARELSPMKSNWP